MKGRKRGKDSRFDLSVKDCRAFDRTLTTEQVDWLGRLARAARADGLVIPLSDKRDDDDHVVYCDRDGTWRAGRYIGSLVFEGHTLTIEPRFGPEVAKWLTHSHHVQLTETLGELTASSSFVAVLLAMAWGSAFASAARHGLPALRTEAKTKGSTLRGRLSVQDSIALRASGRPDVVSVRRERTLDHVLSDVIVAAYTVLCREMRGLPVSWLPRQVEDMMPALIAASGARPAIPSEAELARIRYTPITAGFARVADLSYRIATGQGMGVSAAVDGQVHGVLLDVAELWELHVLDTLRRNQDFDVRHGTRDAGARGSLLRSAVDGRAHGTLIPDALLYEDGQVRVVVDAKYKNVREPQREDLYQMTAYLQHFRTRGQPVTGMLVYPHDPESADRSAIEDGNPWQFDDETELRFIALPADDAAAGSHCVQVMADVKAR